MYVFVYAVRLRLLSLSLNIIIIRPSYWGLPVRHIRVYYYYFVFMCMRLVIVYCSCDFIPNGLLVSPQIIIIAYMVLAGYANQFNDSVGWIISVFWGPWFGNEIERAVRCNRSGFQGIEKSYRKALSRRRNNFAYVLFASTPIHTIVGDNDSNHQNETFFAVSSAIPHSNHLNKTIYRSFCWKQIQLNIQQLLKNSFILLSVYSESSYFYISSQRIWTYQSMNNGAIE